MKLLFIAMLLSVSSLSFAFEKSDGMTEGVICSSDLNEGQTSVVKDVKTKISGATNDG